MSGSTGPLVRVGSLNPAKVQPVRDVFRAWWPEASVEGVAVVSGVPDQPIGEAQTRQGAVNRARAALALVGQREGWGVGLEGGVAFQGTEGWLFGMVAVAHAREGQVRVEVSRTAELRLPPLVAARVRAGEELGPVMDHVLGLTDLKRGVGSVGALTGGLITRADVWRQAVALAATPLRDGLPGGAGLYPGA
ncbi:inosine/xanthosine triphosphatase [Deinococcus aluminii]|uniref:inosine/xanthosine triphosphatase n=1 Tax=Deinococcus aluminii TaxID=1656885 RepID=A0ABP9XAP6_9DEIO